MSLFLILAFFSVNTTESLLRAEFTLTTTLTERTTDTEVVKGNLYLLTGPVVLFQVSSPVNQLMWVRRDTTDIYYPEEHKLFRIVSRDTLPTSNSTVPQLFNLDFEHQLHATGFKVTKSENKGDTLLLHWNNPEVRASPEIVTGSIGKDFVLYRTSGRGWSLEVKLWDYRSIDGKRYPHFMRSTVTKGRFTKTEELRLAHIQMNQSLPRHLAEFVIPEDAEIKITEW